MSYPRGRFASAVHDVVQGVELTPIWFQVGINQLIARYRRTILGPFWIAGSLIATALALWFVFGSLMGADYHSTFAYIIAGIMGWSLVGASIVEATAIFTSASSMLQMHRFPLMFYVFLQTHRVVINFGHQLVAFWLILLALRMFPIPHWTLVPSLALILVTITGMSLMVGMISARYKDVSYLIGIVMQMLFFLSPVFWLTNNLPPKRQFLVDYNPFAQMLELVRKPLLGASPSLYNWAFVILLTMATWLGALIALTLYRKRVVFWV